MTGPDIIKSIIVLAGILFVLVLFLQERKARIVPAPTLPWVKRRVSALFREFLPESKAENIAELGCGWGGLTAILARQYPHACISGYEISFFPYVVSRLRALRFRGRVKIHRTDFFMQDMSRYQGIFCYLSPQIMADLKPHLEKCAKGTVIISNAFYIPGWTPVKTDETNVIVRILVYCYIL